MENQQFKNLSDFFDYLEFCPLCNSRTIMTTTFQASACDVGGSELSFHDFINPWNKFSINLLNNSISKNYFSSKYPSDAQIVIGRQCTKYHFFYNGTANVSKEKLLVSNIFLDKYHFIRIHGPTHFTVNGSLEKSYTSIRITTSNFKTREINLPFINFDLTSKKKIDAKLKNIELLG